MSAIPRPGENGHRNERVAIAAHPHLLLSKNPPDPQTKMLTTKTMTSREYHLARQFPPPDTPARLAPLESPPFNCDALLFHWEDDRYTGARIIMIIIITITIPVTVSRGQPSGQSNNPDWIVEWALGTWAT